MGLFKIFPKSHIDEEILEKYLEIQILISDIYEKFQEFLKYIYKIGYYKNNHKDKKFYSILWVYDFFKKIREDFFDCYSVRKNKRFYDFNKSAATFAEKKEIETELDILIRLLKKIEEYVDKLDKINIKNNDFRELEKDLKELKKRNEYLKIIQKRDSERIKAIIRKIVRDAEENKRRGIWLLDQKNKRSKLLFSNNLSISELRVLDIVPLLPLIDLEHDLESIRGLHKDSTLPIYHYNIEINGKDIHVVPKNLNGKLKKYLIAS